MKGVIRICILGILLVLAGCRSESLVEADELYREQIDKIKFFENYEKDKNHRYDEKWLNYKDTSNPAIPFSQSLKTLLVNRPEVADVIKKHYGEIYWEATSELMESEEGDKVVYYPIIGKGKDKNKYVLKSIVNKNHTYLRFEIQTREKEKLASQMIDDFSKYLNDDEVMKSRCEDRNGVPTCDIDAVEIIGRKNRGIQIPIPPFGLAPANPPYYWDIGEGRYVGIECMNIGGCGESLPLPPPVDNNDPCEKINDKNKESKSIMNNKNIADKSSEMTRNLKTDKNEKSFTFGKDTNGVYKTSDIKEGDGNMTAPFSPISSSFTTEGIVHTHTPDLYNTQSVGDIYSLYKANSLNNNFIYNFTISIDETYVISIIDANKFKRFNQQYPESEYFDMENVYWKEGTVIRKDFDRAHHQFLQSGMNTDDAFGYAMASVMKKYNMGITISKRFSDSQGEFKTLYVNIQENTNIRNRHKRYNYTKTENCNH